MQKNSKKALLQKKFFSPLALGEKWMRLHLFSDMKQNTISVVGTLLFVELRIWVEWSV